MSTGVKAVTGPSWLRRLLAGVTVEEVQRFDGALDLTRTELARRRGSGDQQWAAASQAEIDNADKYRAAFKLDAAWSALNSAKRQIVWSFAGSELVAEARIVRHQAHDKLTGWRGESVTDLLPKELLDTVSLGSGGLTIERRIRSRKLSAPIDEPESSDRGGPATRDDAGAADSSAAADAPFDYSSLVDDLQTRLIAAKELVDTQSDNIYHKYRILRRAVIITTTLLAVFLIALMAIVALEWVPSSLINEDSPLGNWRLLSVVMCLGIIGAVLSSATNLRDRDDKLRIPDLRVRYTLMGMRPAVGAAGAIVVVVIIQSALGETIALEPTALPAVAIAAGFTERLVTRTVTSAANAVGNQ